MIHIIYHASDFDGKFSGLLVRLFCKSEKNVELIPMDHENKKNFNYQKINKEDVIILLDFSFDFDVMKYINENAGEFIWIDHHISAMNICKDLHIKGLRSIKHSAAKLALIYFFDDAPSNSNFRDIIDLISIYDIWDEKNEKWEDANIFQNGCKLSSWDPRDNNIFDFFQTIFKSSFDAQDFQLETLEQGRIISKYKEIANKELASRVVFPCMFQSYRAIVINGHGNSQLFDSIDLTPYEIRLIYNFNGKSYVFSIYQGNPQDDVDCSELAKRNGGGGHRGASGFDVQYIEFVNGEDGLELIVK